MRKWWEFLSFRQIAIIPRKIIYALTNQHHISHMKRTFTSSCRERKVTVFLLILFICFPLTQCQEVKRRIGPGKGSENQQSGRNCIQLLRVYFCQRINQIPRVNTQNAEKFVVNGNLNHSYRLPSPFHTHSGHCTAQKFTPKWCWNCVLGWKTPHQIM